MSHDYKPRVNLKLTQLTHRLLKVWCAERDLTLQAGATRLIEEGIKRKVGAAAAAGMAETAPGVWHEPLARQVKPPTPDGPIRVCSACFAVSPADAETCHECGKPLPPQAKPGDPLPWATLEDARHSQITCDIFQIPLDWVEWSTEEGRTRAQVIADGEGDDAGYSYDPPPKAAPDEASKH
jgi:hypothetical protein